MIFIINSVQNEHIIIVPFILKAPTYILYFCLLPIIITEKY